MLAKAKLKGREAKDFISVLAALIPVELKRSDLQRSKVRLLMGCLVLGCVINKTAYDSTLAYSLDKGPSLLTMPRQSFVISLTLVHPVSCMHLLNSFSSVSTINSTPFSPS